MKSSQSLQEQPLSLSTDQKKGKRTIHHPDKGLLELYYSWRRCASYIAIAFGNKPNLPQGKETHRQESETLNPSKQHSLTESFGAK